MSTTTDSKVRIQLENFSVTDEIEVMKKVSRNIGAVSYTHLTLPTSDLV